MNVETEQVTALATIEALTPMQLFAPGALNPILERIKAEVRAIETDISTEAGRRAIASTAYKIARSKTFIDAQRVALVGDRKREIAAIDAEGKRMRDELDALKEEFEQPLTEWKDAEKARILDNEDRIRQMTQILSAFDIDTPKDVDRYRAMLDKLWDHNFQEFTKRAVQQHDLALMHLAGESKRIADAEALRAELKRKKAEADEKARVEREARIAEEARLNAEAEAKRREEAQAAAARQREEELTRIAAEEKARLERERKASEERLQKSLDEAKAKAQRDQLAAEERARQAEADRVAARERAEAEREAAVIAERRRQEDIRRKEEQERAEVAKEKARREADKAHRQQIYADAVIALIGQVPELTSVAARSVIKVIADGRIPGISITY